MNSMKDKKKPPLVAGSPRIAGTLPGQDRQIKAEPVARNAKSIATDPGAEHGERIKAVKELAVKAIGDRERAIEDLLDVALNPNSNASIRCAVIEEFHRLMADEALYELDYAFSGIKTIS